MTELDGRIGIVSGAGSGIGRAIALRLAQEGAAVVAADIDPQRGEDTVQRIEEQGGEALFVRADVAVENDVREMVRFAEERFGGLDILVNNAGIAPDLPFPEAAPAHWRRTLEVNLGGTMLAIHYALRAMKRRRGGAIVNISSMAGVGYRSYDTPEYATSKAGIVRLTASLGFMKDRWNVRVNCICPGWVETEAVRRSLAEMTQAQKEAQSFPPPAVLIRPEQVADVVMGFIRDGTLAGRVMVWPDGENPRLIPTDTSY